MGAVLLIHRYLLILLFCIAHVSCQKIGSSVTQISFKTGSFFGGDGEALQLTVHWNGTNFACTKYPNAKDQNYACAPSSTPGTRNPSIEYYIYVHWPRANAPLQITEFILTDDVGSTYTIRQFCHSPAMQCTLDDAEGVSSGTMPACTRWTTKDGYNNIQLGPFTQFSALYVDIPIFGSRFANQVVEGGVRPPDLVRAGITTGAASIGAGEIASISIQWDTALYQCDLEPNSASAPFECTLSNSLHCPALTDDYWMSVYNDQNGADILLVAGIWFEDETTTKYTYSQQFCRDNAAPNPQTCDTTADCGSMEDCDEIYIGGDFMGTTFPKLVPFLVPECVFEHPDSTGGFMDVGAGSILTTTPQPEEFGWDSAQYGGPIVTECQPTPEPTTDPTSNPTTNAPTRAPSNAPSNAPTAPPTTAPSSAPTVPPTPAPSVSPSSAPSAPPTVAPTLAPSDAPSSAPTAPPTVAPSAAPSITPTAPPTNAPSNAPSIAPSIAPTAPPTSAPSVAPSSAPSAPPTVVPSASPSFAPSIAPSSAPTNAPSDAPSFAPSIAPSSAPTNAPSDAPSSEPSAPPTAAPSGSPSLPPSVAPSSTPIHAPSGAPTAPPSVAPSSAPTLAPSYNPTFTRNPTIDPTTDPTAEEPNETEAKSNVDSLPSALTEWIASNWIYVPLVIIALCACVCGVVFVVMERRKKAIAIAKSLGKSQVPTQSPRSDDYMTDVSKVQLSSVVQMGTSVDDAPALPQQVMAEWGQIMKMTSNQAVAVVPMEEDHDMMSDVMAVMKSTQPKKEDDDGIMMNDIRVTVDGIPPEVEDADDGDGIRMNDIMTAVNGSQEELAIAQSAIAQSEGDKVAMISTQEPEPHYAKSQSVDAVRMAKRRGSGNITAMYDVGLVMQGSAKLTLPEKAEESYNRKDSNLSDDLFGPCEQEEDDEKRWICND